MPRKKPSATEPERVPISAPAMPALWMFFGHHTTPMFGVGTEADARNLLNHMNRGRATNLLMVRQVIRENGERQSAFDLAAALAQHRANV